jgi:hypothetical protein
VSAAAYGAVSDVVGEDDNGATGVGGSGVAVGSGASGGAGAGSVGPGGTQVQVQAQGIDTANAIIIEGEELVQDEVLPCGKRHKRCTSNVWHYFTKKKLIKEANGKTYLQVWAHCNQPGCKHKARAEGNYGTTGFLIHLRTAQSLVNVTSGFKGKSECIEHMCARIKLHTCIDAVNTKTQCKSVKRVLKLYYMTECLRIEHKRVLAAVKDVSTGS